MLLAANRSDATEDQPITYEIIEAVAEREGVDATDIEPPEYDALYDVLNPEALDTVFASREDGTPRGNGWIEFTFCGYEFVVTSDGKIEIQD